jgi:hypothetical protein
MEARWEGYIMSLLFLLFCTGTRGILDISIESRCGVDDAFDVPSSEVSIFPRSYSGSILESWEMWFVTKKTGSPKGEDVM